MLVWICSTCPFSPNNHVFFLMRYPNQKKCQDDSDSFQKAFLVLSVAVWGGRNLKNLPRWTTACSWILSIPQTSCVIHLPSYWLSGVHHQETEVSETNSTWHWQNRHCVAPTSDRGALNMKERVVSVASDESKAYCEENSGVWNSGSKNCDWISQIRSSKCCTFGSNFLQLSFWILASRGWWYMRVILSFRCTCKDGSMKEKVVRWVSSKVLDRKNMPEEWQPSNT